MSNKYVTIKLPRNIVDEIDKFVGNYGFVSRTEVVKEALRKLFQQYQVVKEAERSEDESKP
jgi:metal-responsive CopG/Arc/MetJ family transcriptional regulator